MSLDAKSREESGLRRKNRESDSMSDDINEIWYNLLATKSEQLWELWSMDGL